MEGVNAEQTSGKWLVVSYSDIGLHIYIMCMACDYGDVYGLGYLWLWWVGSIFRTGGFLFDFVGGYGLSTELVASKSRSRRVSVPGAILGTQDLSPSGVVAHR